MVIAKQLVGGAVRPYHGLVLKNSICRSWASTGEKVMRTQNDPL